MKNAKLLIDADCPMCRMYGRCFVQYGLVEPEVIDAYQTIDDEFVESINMDRARNEIALSDTATGETVYGVDALIAIITENRPRFKKLLSLPSIYAILKGLYSFISYNRKVIMPSEINDHARSCIPDLHKGYRWSYILFVAVVTGIIVNQFAVTFSDAIGFSHNWYREFIICFGQVAWQWIAVQVFSPHKSLDYLGNMSTVSLMGSILVLVLLSINSVIGFGAVGLGLGFLAIVGFMFFEHIRRCRILGVPGIMTASWVLFRMTALVAIIKLMS